MGDAEGEGAEGPGLSDGKFLTPLADDRDRARDPALVDRGPYHDLVDCPRPEGRGIFRPRLLHPLPFRLDGGHLDPGDLVPALCGQEVPKGNELPWLQGYRADPGLPLLAQDDPDRNLLLFRGHPAVGVAADGAADDGVAGFVHEEMLAFLAAGGAGEGDMHFI